MMELLSSPDAWLQFVMLSVLEIVLGIDNLVFLSIVSAKLPEAQRSSARRLGLVLAVLMRVGLLLSLSWIMSLQEPLFTVVKPWSGHDLVLLLGGGFLIWKSSKEIWSEITIHPPHAQKERNVQSYWGAIITIGMLDIVFSLDSVITAVGVSKHVPIMVAAILLAIGIMLVFVNAVADFIESNPGIKMLAVTFLVLIGLLLVLESTGMHPDKNYLYAAMGFSMVVELLNMRARKAHAASPPA